MTPKSLFRKSCKPCRQRHLKCDQTKPKCTNCQKSRHDVRCYYEPKGFRFQRCVVLSEITHSAEPGKENSEEDDSGPAESSQSHQDNPTVDASQHGRIHTDGNDDIEEHDVARSESAPRHSPPVSADTRQASYSPGVSDDIASEHDVVVQPDVCQDHSLVGIPPRSNLPIPIALNEPSVSDLHHVHHVSQVSVTSEAFPSPSHLPLIPSSSLGLSGIANDTEAFILKYYLENAGPWLDIVSPTRFFGIHVPQLMIGEPALLSACLAYSSLVLHLHGQVSMQVKDELYERALRQFVPCIAVYREGDGPVHNIGPIHATTVILRMTEQFLELGQDRQHHLHGSSTLFETAHHDWSLLEDTQSSTSFWAYLRGSLRVSFLLEQPCPFELRYLSVWRYASKDPVLTDEARSNLMTYLLAEVCTLCWGDPAAEASTSKLDELRDAILQWREYLPPSFQPWYRNDDEGNVFPDIRFLAPWHCVAWQFYYTAEVMLAVHSSSLRREKNIFRLTRLLEERIAVPTRQLCGITMSINHPGVKMNGSHLVAWCAQFITAKAEQNEISNMLLDHWHDIKWPNLTCRDRLRGLWDGTREFWVEASERQASSWAQTSG